MIITIFRKAQAGLFEEVCGGGETVSPLQRA
jgi:hypothetical protein